VTVFPLSGKSVSRGNTAPRSVADLELILAGEQRAREVWERTATDFQGRLLTSEATVAQLSAELDHERARQAHRDQAMAALDDRIAALAAQVRELTHLRDNFHQLYREERTAREAAELAAGDAAEARDRIEGELIVLQARTGHTRRALERVR
jgi:chromosome segregation ATPase